MAFGNPFVRVALAIAASTAGFKNAVLADFSEGILRVAPKKRRYTTNWKMKLKGQTNGARECARRIRQIERGQHGCAC